MIVLLTHAYYLREDPREQLIMKPYVPLGILSISAYLEKHGVPNSVYDTTFNDFETHCRELVRLAPQVIGIYTNLMTRLNVLRLIRFIRGEPALQQSRIVLGGPEVRHSSKQLLQAGAHFIVNGEGERTLLELCRFMMGEPVELGSINGIEYIEEQLHVRTPEREQIKNLDELPFPARNKVNLQLYFDAWKKRHGTSAISVSTMRGCPYTCRWCSRAVYGQSYRRRSAQIVVQELKEIQEHHSADTIWFVDDVFTISHKWMFEFQRQLQLAGLRIKYECITRADRLNDEMIRLLKETGCFRVWIGAESGSQRIIDAMDRRVEVAQVREMIIRSRKAGIEAGTFIMVGYPGETEADLKETLRHLKISQPDHYTVTITYPIRGTPLYEETEPHFIHPPAWEEGTDRQIDFRRTYSRKYYDYAIRWMANEMAAQRLRGTPKALWHLAKSAAARTGMALERLTGNS